MTDDGILLRRYATDKCGDAFAEIVRRHLPLVYSAALRRLGGDGHRAEDVAQVVFCTLARNAARLAGHPALTAWLYTATRHEALDIIRAEKRRRIREGEAHTMEEIAQRPDAPADWSQLRPVLDSAMDRLGERDREVVLLRFFQGRPFAEIGAVAGLSEDAARKRVERALDKLRESLRPHGIASTSTALATLLANQTVSAAPAALAANVTGAALSAGATAGVTTLIAVTKLQAGIAAAVAVGGVVGLVTQHRTIVELREARTPTQSMAAAPAPASGAVVASPPAPRTAVIARQQGRGIGRPVTDVDSIPEPNPYVTPRASSPLSKLQPLPATPDVERQKAELHRRYDPFLQQRGLTSAQADRVVELFVHQAIAREDLQESVRATGTPGDAPGVEKLRGQLYEPITRELYEILGYDGYRAYVEYMKMIFYRDGFVAALLPQFAAVEPLSSEQMEQLIKVVAANDHPERVRPSDIGSRARIDWAAVAEQSRAVLTPPQLAVLENHVLRQQTPPP